MDEPYAFPPEDAHARWVTLDDRVRSLAEKFCGGIEHAPCIFAGRACQASVCKNSSYGFMYLHKCHDDPRTLAAAWGCEVLALDHERAEKGPFLLSKGDWKVVLTYLEVLSHLRAHREGRAIELALAPRLQRTSAFRFRL